jgi:hypothetical protein
MMRTRCDRQRSRRDFARLRLRPVSPEARQFALSLPEWMLSGVSVLVGVAWGLWFAFGSVPVAELWHWTRVRFSHLSRRA